MRRRREKRISIETYDRIVRRGIEKSLGLPRHSISNPSPHASTELRRLADKIAEAVFSCYNEKYVDKCLREEPESFLALASRLRDADDGDLPLECHLIIGRVKEIYRPEVVERCFQGNPESLLGLVKTLEAALG
jgi:hypothetical protein